MTECYKTKRIIDGKPPIWVIVDENGKIINRNPSKDELKLLTKFPKENYKINKRNSYSDKQLLYFPRQFFEEYG